MNIPFEPTNSFCYKVARYELLDLIAQEPEASSGLPFKMGEVAKHVIERNYTFEQLSIEIPAAQANRVDTVLGSIKKFVQIQARRSANSPFIWLRDGMYKLKADSDIEQEIEDAELEAVNDESDGIEFDGWIYAFSFPVLIKEDGSSFPIKIGRTIKDVNGRVAYQCRGSASFDNPIVLSQWQVSRVGAVESAIHSLLKSRGKWRENVPGTEWFNTTVAEIESIVKFIQQS